MHSLAARNANHAASAVGRLAKLDAPVDEQLFVSDHSDSTLNPAGYHVINAFALLLTIAARGAHESAQGAFGGCVLLVAVYSHCITTLFRALS